RVPSDGQTFAINDADFTSLRIDPNGPTDASGNLIRSSPTLFGANLPAEELPRLLFTDAQGNNFSLSSPTGLGLSEVIPLNAVPSAMVQVGIGLFKNTEVKVRFAPESILSSENEFSVGMFGIGIMHDLKQWVPGLKQLPIDVSGFVGWNRINATIFMDKNSPDQKAEFATSGFTLQGLVSKKFAILTLFAGAGIANTSTTFQMLGQYETQNATLQDPINFSFASTGPRINAGFRLKLLILTLHADYAIQKYSTLTVGAGISIR
ncbi:MAG: hypothetical protein HRT61_23040, partial [Ekhidna sp.]|nr:hypothetical protein [Ekhidna sp.]